LLGRVGGSEQDGGRGGVCRGLPPPALGTLALLRLRGGGGRTNVALPGDVKKGKR
jgi:hypothetical protein